MPHDRGAVKRLRAGGREECPGNGHIAYLIITKEVIIRVYIAFALLGVFFLVGDVVSRTVMRLVLALAGSRRERVLYVAQRWIAGMIIGLLAKVGGAGFEINVSIPGEDGHLVFVNHQSLVDIPLMIRATVGGYPLFIARSRYRYGTLFVSVMLRMYGHAFVTEGSRDPAQIEMLRDFARNATQPVVIFPEGHRTRDGQIRPWKMGGGRAILETRPWVVHVVVLDGLWQAVSLGQSMKTISKVRCRAQEVSRHEFDPARDDAGALMRVLEEEMRAGLAKLREGSAPAGAKGERASGGGDASAEVTRAG